MFNTDYYHSRYFNVIAKKNDILIKSSTNIEKIIAEYEYYYFLPNNLKRYFVQPFNLQINEDKASYDMECINYKNLAELFQSEYVSPESFNQLLEKIEYFKNTTYDENYSQVAWSSNYLVLEKTRNRIDKMPEYKMLFHRIENAFNKYIKTRKTWNTVVSHGDLCFSNIIWIKEINMIKFIDPRGAQKPNDIFMDEYYDLAKLSHSIFGGYESIIYNSNIDYEHIKNTFIQYLNSKDISLELLKVYEASLFLSMIPLHKDSHNNVKRFATVCDKLLQEIGF